MAAAHRPAPGPLGSLVQVLLPFLVLAVALFFGAFTLIRGLARFVIYHLVTGVRMLLGKQPLRPRSPAGAAPERGGTESSSQVDENELEEFHGSLEEYMRLKKGRGE